MAAHDPLQTVRDSYGAYESGDRSILEETLSEDFTFYSPPDPGIDRATYFERCWPNSELIESFDFVRLIESGDEVVVTYESTKTDGSRFRNTEVLTFDGDKISKVEVYFGWDLQ
jgi:ketosteroid isomerase-like protein